MMVKVDPGAQVNMIPLSQYQKISTHKISETRFSKPNTLSQPSLTWISHDGTSAHASAYAEVWLHHPIQVW